MSSARREAIFILTRYLSSGDFPARLLPQHPQRAFITDLVYTTVRWQRALDWALRRFVKKMPQSETRSALLLGACQLLRMPDVTDYAAVNESVAAAKLSSRRSAGLVNGVLRNLARARTTILAELEQQPLALRHSHPDKLVARWLQRLGAAETEELCRWNNLPAETWLAFNPGCDQAPVEHLVPHPSRAHFYKLARGMPVERVPGYDSGAFIVQDPATAAAVELLNVRPGLKILDGCAAPGGKSIQIAWRMGEPREHRHQLVALERHADRLSLLRENLARTGHDWVTSIEGDLTGDTSALLQKYGTFDRILLDVPCSNSGVLRRRPDARWRWHPKRLATLLPTQRALLESALELLAPGGRIVYSTCSLEPEENQEQIDNLISAHPELAVIGCKESLPARERCDGAFTLAFERRNNATL